MIKQQSVDQSADNLMVNDDEKTPQQHESSVSLSIQDYIMKEQLFGSDEDENGDDEEKKSMIKQQSVDQSADNLMVNDDEKTPQQSSSIQQWIHYQGFAQWLKKKSVIK
eukprot:185523_1